MKKTVLTWLVVSFLCWGVSPAAAFVPVDSCELGASQNIAAYVPRLPKNATSDVQECWNEIFRETVSNPLREFSDVYEKAYSDKTLPEHMIKGMFFKADFSVALNQYNVLSVVQRIYTYTGGAHGMTRTYAHTLNPATGTRYRLEDLFVPGSDYLTTLNIWVEQEMGRRPGPFWKFSGVQPDSPFYLTMEGLVIFFMPYEIAPYSSGTIRFLIPYEALRGMMKSDLQHLGS